MSSGSTQFKVALIQLLEDYPTELPKDIRIVDFAIHYQIADTPMGYAVQAYQVIKEHHEIL